MKKILSLIATALCVALAFTLAACNYGEEPNGGDNQIPVDSDENNSDAATGSGILVVYFSAQNHTETVANYIATATGGALFELAPVNPYSTADLNYNNHDSRVYQEYIDESLRDTELLSYTVEDWETYDTVFIGYPIWWGIAAWPVNNFIKHNDFTGKTVIPFCTSASSGLGASGTLLAEMAGTGDWQTGQRFSSGASQSTVISWLDGMDLVA